MLFDRYNMSLLEKALNTDPRIGGEVDMPILREQAELILAYAQNRITLRQARTALGASSGAATLSKIYSLSFACIRHDLFLIRPDIKD